MQAFFHNIFAPFLSINNRYFPFAFSDNFLCHLHQEVLLLPPVEYHVFQGLTQFDGNIVIHDTGSRIDNAEVHSPFYIMVKKHGVHGFTDIVITPKRKRKIAHATANMCSWQVFTNPLRCTKKIKRIRIMLRNASANGQYIGVKNNVLRGHAHHLRQQAEGTLAYFDFAFEGVGLTFFVKSHDHNGSAKLPNCPCTLHEDLLTLFQRYRVDNTFSLYALQACFNDLPF